MQTGKPAKWAARGALALAVTFSLQTLAAAQCAMCRTALTSSAEGHRWARGIDHGILLLLAAPFLIVARFLFSIYRREIMAGVTRAKARCFVWASKLRTRSHTPVALESQSRPAVPEI